LFLRIKISRNIVNSTREELNNESEIPKLVNQKLIIFVFRKSSAIKKSIIFKVKEELIKTILLYQITKGKKYLKGSGLGPRKRHSPGLE